MPYFAALLARSADRWTARDADLDEIEDLADLAELMRRSFADADEEPETELLLIEQEDAWFAVVRFDPEEDPRLFVSDLAAVARSAHADLLLTEGLVPVAPDGTALSWPVSESDAADSREAGAVVGEPVADRRADEGVEIPLAGDDAIPLTLTEPTIGLGMAVPRPLPASPAGDASLLADLGVSAPRLAQLCHDGLLPADAIAQLAEALGAVDELEEVR